ncbi:hypothetical protein Dda_4527 [Drechslerella dactyloides]|uniref:Uncharacterized protein n=1 Tax=Drechslerella dactyloides TaxID=74499 RepID=A0AAD6NJC8_DREDA|nr:hypothetical protein Dda_4527 [Drechslerella dactyloides]
MRPTPLLKMRPAMMLRMSQTPRVAMRQSPILRMAVPKEEQSGTFYPLKDRAPIAREYPQLTTYGRGALVLTYQTNIGHTVTQRLRRLKDIPVELIPLGVVIGAALVAAGYAMVHKLSTDKTLRLSRQNKEH